MVMLVVLKASTCVKMRVTCISVGTFVQRIRHVKTVPIHWLIHTQRSWVKLDGKNRLITAAAAATA